MEEIPPISYEWDDTSPKHIFKHSIDSFNLALRLRLKFRWVPIASWKLSQNLEVKMLPRSELISNGMPWRDMILETYKSANWLAEIVSLTGRKWATLENRSIKTKMASWPFYDQGKPVKKSISILSHFHSGIKSGCRVPAGLWCSALTRRQTSHSST